MHTIKTGDQFRTLTNGLTSPYPKLSKRMTKTDLAKCNQWLMENAAAEANRQGNDFAKHQFEHLNPKNWTTADSESALQFTFGAQYVDGRIAKLKVGSEEKPTIDEQIDVQLDPMISWAFY
ncbi:hypothetical protein [Photobacterium damselae]|uniref:hypothetical protein n=1 Tax=Photobacterium damselae TaxID=38293 RepID=UPI0015A0EAD1|nr:hypothetical protein [Photobacterium damselae]NVO59956.1 hypothetical protein [Photobacterium damselae subsp. damselae]